MRMPSAQKKAGRFALDIYRIFAEKIEFGGGGRCNEEENIEILNKHSRDLEEKFV